MRRLARWAGRLAIPVLALVTVGLAVWAVVEGFVGGVIGAAGAIIGGALTAWYQSQRTADLARKLRREERQEEALLRLDRLLAEVSFRVASFHASKKADPNTRLGSFLPDVIKYLRDTYHAWWQDLDSRVFDEAVRDAVVAFAPEQRALELERKGQTDSDEQLSLLDRTWDEVKKIRKAIRVILQARNHSRPG